MDESHALKALNPTGYNTQNNCWRQNLLGNKQWRVGIKHCEKRLPLKQRSFRERGSFSLKLNILI